MSPSCDLSTDFYTNIIMNMNMNMNMNMSDVTHSVRTLQISIHSAEALT